jgi:hypothetical protein
MDLGSLNELMGCQLTALVECSMRKNRFPPAIFPVRLAENDSSFRSWRPG